MADGDVGYDMPYIKHTFLAVPPKPLAYTERRRARSVPVENTCDLYAREVHALMFKPQGIYHQTGGRRLRSRTSSTTSLDDSAGADQFEHTSTDFCTAQSSMSSCDAFPTQRSRSRTGHSQVSFASSQDLTAFATDLASSENEWSAEHVREQKDPQSRQIHEPEDEEPIESVLARVPRDAEGRPLSLGSSRHEFGDCRPCAYFANRHRPCANGARCTFCHFPHPPKRRNRLSRRRRLEMKEIVSAMVSEAGEQGVRPPPKYVPISWSTVEARESGSLVSSDSSQSGTSPLSTRKTKRFHHRFPQE